MRVLGRDTDHYNVECLAPLQRAGQSSLGARHKTKNSLEETERRLRTSAHCSFKVFAFAWQGLCPSRLMTGSMSPSHRGFPTTHLKGPSSTPITSPHCPVFSCLSLPQNDLMCPLGLVDSSSTGVITINPGA